MEQQEVTFYEMLKDLPGLPTKAQVVKARNIYNKYNEQKITDCGCSVESRRNLYRIFLEWYESVN